MHNQRWACKCQQVHQFLLFAEAPSQQVPIICKDCLTHQPQTHTCTHTHKRTDTHTSTNYLQISSCAPATNTHMHSHARTHTHTHTHTHKRTDTKEYSHILEGPAGTAAACAGAPPQMTAHAQTHKHTNHKYTHIL